jgi:hypothetical protein
VTAIAAGRGAGGVHGPSDSAPHPIAHLALQGRSAPGRSSCRSRCGRRRRYCWHPEHLLVARRRGCGSGCGRAGRARRSGRTAGMAWKVGKKACWRWSANRNPPPRGKPRRRLTCEHLPNKITIRWVSPI